MDWLEGEIGNRPILPMMSSLITANLFMNTVISYEVFVLLNNSHNMIRHRPPSTRRVLCQAIVVYIISILLAVLFTYLYSDGVGLNNSIGFKIILPIYLCISFGVPFLILILFCICIWKRRLVRSSDKHLKNLAIYFLRIIITFVVTLIPAGVCFFIAFQPSISRQDGNVEIQTSTLAIGYILLSLQAILSTLLSFLKPDIRQLTTNLFTTTSSNVVKLFYCCCYCCYNKNNSNRNNNNNDNNNNDNNNNDNDNDEYNNNNNNNNHENDQHQHHHSSQI
jgi:hypothetical protein